MDIVKFLIGLPVLAFLLYAPGAVLLNSLGRRSSRHAFSDVAEWLFTAVLASFLLTGVTGFVLAETGLFRPWLLLLISLLACLVLAVGLGQAGLRPRPLLALLRWPTDFPQRVTDRRVGRLQALGLAVCIVVGAALFARPAEMLRGALDSGVYVNAGVSLARTGAIYQRDILMRQLNNDTGEVNELMQGLSRDRYTLDRLRMSGFYVLDKKGALVIPQHYSLYPVWIGLMYSLFGIWGALYANSLIALLGVIAVYFFARRAFNPGAALLGLGLLVLCPVTIWFARYPVSEVLMGLLAFASCFAFMRAVQLARKPPAASTPHAESLPPDTESRDTWPLFWGAMAGVSLGQMALARPDFIFYFAPLPAYFIYWRLTRRWQRAYTWMLGGLALMLAIFVVHFSFYSFAYTLDLYHNVIQDLRRIWAPLLIALYGGTLLLVALDRLHPRIAPLWLRLESLAQRYRFAWVGVLILAIAAYAVYHYAIGPWLPNNRTGNAGNPIPQEVTTTLESYIGAPVDQGSRYNLLRVGWYLSPLGMLLGVGGMLRWMWNRLNASTALFLGMFVVLSYVFIQETYTEAHYIYSMRRYVPIILPGLLMGVAWACQWLWSKVRPRQVGAVVAAGLALALAVFFGYTARVIVPHVEERGAVAEFNDLAKRFPNPSKSVVLFSNDRDEPYLISTPLQFIYGIESFVLWRTYPDINNTVIAGIVKRWQSQGYDVYVMMSANGGKLDLPGMSLRQMGSWDYNVPEYEQQYYQKPSNVYTSYLPWGIYKIEPQAATPTLPFSLNLGEMDYPSLVAGFNIQESSDGGKTYWRWTGDHAILRVPMPTTASGTYDGARITLRMRPETPTSAGPLRTQPLTVKLALDDTQVGQVTLNPGTDFTDYTITVPPGTHKSSLGNSTALLHIYSPTWSGRSAGLGYDARVLGVQLDGVAVSK